MKASFSVNLERFTVGRLSYIPGIVKLLESPGQAGGLPKRNYQNGRISDGPGWDDGSRPGPHPGRGKGGIFPSSPFLGKAR